MSQESSNQLTLATITSPMPPQDEVQKSDSAAMPSPPKPNKGKSNDPDSEKKVIYVVFPASEDEARQEPYVLLPARDGDVIPRWLAEALPKEMLAKAKMIWNKNMSAGANVAVLYWGVLTAEGFIENVSSEWNKTINDLAWGLNVARDVITYSSDRYVTKSLGEIEEEEGQPLPWNGLPARLRSDVARALAADNLLTATSLLVWYLFMEGEEAAAYFFTAMVSAIKKGVINVERLDIPAPPAFWPTAAAFMHSRMGATLILVLAAPKAKMQQAFDVFSREHDLNLAAIRRRSSASLRQMFDEAKTLATDLQQTTMMGVNLRDVGHTRLAEEEPEVAKAHLTFAHMFVVGVCPKGVKVWQASGLYDGYTIGQDNEHHGPELLDWAEAEQFVKDFEGFAIAKVSLLLLANAHISDSA